MDSKLPVLQMRKADNQEEAIQFGLWICQPKKPIPFQVSSLGGNTWH